MNENGNAPAGEPSVEVEQRKLQAQVDHLSVHDAMCKLLGLDGAEAEDLIARQLMLADGQVELYAPSMRSVRRAAVGVGFTTGVSFALGVLRARGLPPATIGGDS